LSLGLGVASGNITLHVTEPDNRRELLFDLAGKKRTESKRRGRQAKVDRSLIALVSSVSIDVGVEVITGH